MVTADGAGYETSLVPSDPAAGIGLILVSGKWEASSGASGVQDTSVAQTSRRGPMDSDNTTHSSPTIPRCHVRHDRQHLRERHGDRKFSQR